MGQSAFTSKSNYCNCCCGYTCVINASRQPLAQHYKAAAASRQPPPTIRTAPLRCSSSSACSTISASERGTNASDCKSEVGGFSICHVLTCCVLASAPPSSDAARPGYTWNIVSTLNWRSTTDWKLAAGHAPLQLRGAFSALLSRRLAPTAFARQQAPAATQCGCDRRRPRVLGEGQHACAMRALR